MVYQSYLRIFGDCGVLIGGVEDYLLSSDLLVSFSSTTIEEALQLKKPVLQYDPFDRYAHIPVEKINLKGNTKIAPIYYVARPKELPQSLEWIKNYHLDKANSEDFIDWSPHIINSNEDWISPLIKD